VITKDRVVNVLGVSGAIFCLVMILAGPGQAEEDDARTPTAPPATSQIAPPPAAVPGAPAQSQPSAPPAQQPAEDADGDDDDG